MTALTAALDRVLGRVTMYRLVTLTLTALFLVATVFAATGIATPVTLSFGYAPLTRLGAMLGSAAIALIWSALASWLLARLFRTRAHVESAIVTGWLIFFILPPSLDPLRLLTLGLAGILAAASKYLVAARGRHIVNPAAFGVLVVGILGIGDSAGIPVASAWWLATPALLPFVAVAALLVLYRSRRFSLGLTFAVAATVFGVIRYAVTGADAVSALSFTLVSAPVIFFAGYMISEPLTTPPRRWQRIVYAVLVAALFSIPFSLPGPVVGGFSIGLFSTPELALVVGNVVAFFFGQRRGVHLALRSKRQLTPTSWEFDFEPAGPVRFAAGQYLELTVPHRGADSRGWRRTFSIASAPATAAGEEPAIRLGLRVPAERSSSFKRALLELEPGARVSATSVGGDFLLPADPAAPVLLVAGGIGITPFVAQLEHAAPGRDTVVVYAVSSTDEIAYAVELGRSGARVLLVAPEPLTRMPDGWEWLGADRLTGDALLAAVPDAASRAVYVSGPPAMIAALTPALRRAGARRIRTDAFIGY